MHLCCRVCIYYFIGVIKMIMLFPLLPHTAYCFAFQTRRHTSTGFWSSVTWQIVSSDNMSGLYSRGTLFESQPGHRAIDVEPCPVRQCRDTALKYTTTTSSWIFFRFISLISPSSQVKRYRVANVRSFCKRERNECVILKPCPCVCLTAHLTSKPTRQN